MPVILLDGSRLLCPDCGGRVVEVPSAAAWAIGMACDDCALDLGAVEP